MGNGKGYIPRVSYITNRVSDSSWLYNASYPSWWTTSASSSGNSTSVSAYYVYSHDGYLEYNYSKDSRVVRAVIVIQK